MGKGITGRGMKAKRCPKSEREKLGSSQSLQNTVGLEKLEEKIGDGDALSLDHAP
jgi:hypothetical protein